MYTTCSAKIGASDKDLPVTKLEPILTPLITTEKGSEVVLSYQSNLKILDLKTAQFQSLQ